MFKILYFLVITFFFFIIFSFSHIFYLFGSDYILNIFGRGWYEWIKSSLVILYWILFLIWLLIYFIRYKVYKAGKQLLFYISIITFWLTISTLLSINIWGSIIWLSEKFHWLLFYIALIIFFTSVYFWFEKNDYKKVLNYIFIFSGLLYIYWFIQYLWFDPLATFYDSRVPVTRASSFLWNANYLAWYILILLPLSKFINLDIFRKTFIWISFLALISTWSYFWIFLWILYFLYLLHSFNKKLFMFILVSLVIWTVF